MSLRVLGAHPRRNYFNLSHSNKLTTDFGVLTPIFNVDVLPGDTFKGSAQIFLRFAPLLAPVMHDVNIRTHYFFVPRRICQSNWQDWITGEQQKAHSTMTIDHNPLIVDVLQGAATPGAWTTPTMSGQARVDYAYLNRGSLWDYFDFPAVERNEGESFPGGSIFLQADIFPLVAYQKIYNEFYRDQDLQPMIEDDVDYIESLSRALVPGNPSSASAVDMAYRELFSLRYCSWEKDYFTSARPWPQKGDAVQLPGLNGGQYVFSSPQVLDPITGAQENNMVLTTNSNSILSSSTRVAGTAGNEVGTAANPVNLYGRLSTPGFATVEDLRRAYILQLWLERNARFGTRYIEFIKAHFDENVPDARLQRPEFIGGGVTPVHISEVLQTSATADGTPLATMGGHGYGLGNKNDFRYHATEHGMIIGLMSVMPRSCYTDGIPRRHSRRDRFDYYFPEFANLGEQAILNKELFSRGQSQTVDEQVWGYQARYNEYRFHQSRVHGDFLNLNALGDWHMARQWTSLPSLNSEFISSGDVTHRIFAVESDDQPLWCDIRFKIDAIRPIPQVVNTAMAHHGYGS